MLLKLAYWVLLPLVALLTLALSLESFAAHVNSAPAGKAGDYVVTYHSCPSGLCITGGTFTSDDKSVVETYIFGLGTWQAGQTYRALSQFPYDYAVPLPGRWDPTQAVVGTTGSVLALGVWGWLGAGVLRRRSAASAPLP